MEQPPGSIDDLRPQDLSTSSNATVIDLTRKGEECVRGGATSVEALQMVQSPGWCPSSGAGNPGLTSDITLKSGDQIQPDNALSHTTVTLSCVSRSHVFSSPGSLSQPSPLCGVPAISKLPLNPPCDSDGGLGETGLPLNQHYLEQVDGPVDLATQTELFQSSSQAQAGPESYGPALETRNEINGGVVSGDWDEDEDAQDGDKRSLSWGKNKGLENGQIDSCSSSGVCAESSPETLTPATVEDDETGGSDVLFLVSKNKDSAVHPDSLGSRDLCPLEREYISPLDDPVSPSATSQDDVEDVFVLPQASSSPSGDNSYLETADEAAWDGASTEGANLLDSSVSGSATARLDSSDNNKQPVQRQKTASVPLIDLTDDVCPSDDSESTAKTAAPHVNGNAKALQRALEDKKLPVRSGRGTRLDSIVMNINSSRYTVSGCIRTNKKANQSTVRDSKFTDAKQNNTPSAGKRTRRAKASVTVKQTAASPVKGGKPNNVNTDSFKDSTSDSEVNNSKKPQSSTPPKSPQFAAHKNADEQPEQPEQLSPAKPSAEAHVARNSTSPSKSPKKSQGRAKGKSTGSKTPPTAKRKGAHTPRKRRKKHKQSPSSSMFSPKEPEIKLRYVNYKEEKRDFRSDSFSPFIHVERQQSSPSLCTVINYPEEVRTQHKKGQPAQPGGFISATVPSTSCLQLGRVTMHSQHQRSLVCCLCGLSANTMDLGDLHGPYYPEGFQPTTKTPASSSGLREDEDDNDSDASSCSIRDRRRKQAIPHAPRPQRPGAPLKGRGLLAKQRWGTDGPGTPPAKRARVSDAGSVDTEDWYSAPVLPLEPCEYWLHEDCGIWSTGVFLVKGRVYGLEEAVKVAQETLCSACRRPGATLGCFFKSCPNKYHYRCALESDCVLIEENFSMKCKKHKNKMFKAPPGNRLDDR